MQRYVDVIVQPAGDPIETDVELAGDFGDRDPETIFLGLEFADETRLQFAVVSCHPGSMAHAADTMQALRASLTALRACR